MPAPPPLPEWEHEVIEHFISVFETFGLPKSTAKIFGTLYCAEVPMMQEDISARLGISVGSASQGLKLLQNLGAVHREIPEGQRQSYYTAELSVRRLIGHFIDVQLRPKLENGKDSLQKLSQQIPPENAHARQRVQTLQTWQHKAATALPLAARLFGPKP
jgi:DNA-binding transcriptional regulator GbsR (MarR family)